MNQQTIDQIKTELAPLAEKLGQGAEFTWEVVLKQQYVEAMGYALGALLSSFGIVGAVFIFRYSVRTDDDSTASLAIFVTGLLSIIIISLLFYALAHLINPEYYALQEIINMVK